MQQRMQRATEVLADPGNPRALDRTLERTPEPIETRPARAKDFMDNPGGPLAGAGDDFGEVLRHELNNPLTGILGNAELLLAEIRRGNDSRLPPGGLQRLETIAALAVLLRETIRRLSQEWEIRDAELRKRNDA